MALPILKQKYIPHAWESVACLFCDSLQSSLHEKYGCDLQFSYVKCLDCGLVYQSPRPKYDEIFIKDAYGQYFSYDENFQYSGYDYDLWDKELKEILKYDKKQRAILDIGSCMGDFLRVAKKYYSHCVGVEVGENMAKFSSDQLKLEIHQGNYVDLTFGTKFSCVHMSHVIEHIPKPVEWIQKTREILDDQGILVMSVPNVNSLDRRLKLFLKRIGLRKGAWKDNTRTPDHLFEPSIQSSLQFFANNGFRVLEYCTYSNKDMDASTLFGRIYNRKLKLGSNLRFFVTPV